MRSFDGVDSKLCEASFFLEKLAETCKIAALSEVKYYFSAFVSASRSVTFALQASMNGVDGFDTWYNGWVVRMGSNDLAKFFRDCRTDDQKIGYNHIQSGFSIDGETKFFFGQALTSNVKNIPKGDVVTACRAHFKLVCEIVDDAYQVFGLVIDPDQIYTPDGLSKKGWTIEDVEEHAGYPRGYTNLPLDSSLDKNDFRLEMLWRSIPGSQVKELLAHYLGRDLSYPIGPFLAERK